MFRDLVTARMVDPSSKLGMVRMFTEIGLNAHSNMRIRRYLGRVTKRDYRDRISDAHFTYREIDELTVEL